MGVRGSWWYTTYTLDILVAMCKELRPTLWGLTRSPLDFAGVGRDILADSRFVVGIAVSLVNMAEGTRGFGARLAVKEVAVTGPDLFTAGVVSDFEASTGNLPISGSL